MQQIKIRAFFAVGFALALVMGFTCLWVLSY